MRKVLRISGGLVLLLVGAILALPGVPGPGIAIMLGGLAILAEYFLWARRLFDWAKSKWDKVADRLKKGGPGSPTTPA